MLSLILFIILVWVIIPLIILSMLIFSLVIVFGVSDSDQKISVRAGFFAGLILFVIFAVSQLHTIQTPSFSNSTPGFTLSDLGVALVGFIVGFILLWAIRLIIPSRLVGLLTFILAAASLIALFSYIFTSSVRDIGLYVICSTLFGLLFHLMLFPGTLREIADSL